MRLLSETQEERYRTENIDINPIMDDFFKAEEKSLFKQCNTLMDFIKFIRKDADNARKLVNVSQAIIDLTKNFD